MVTRYKKYLLTVHNKSYRLDYRSYHAETLFFPRLFSGIYVYLIQPQYKGYKPINMVDNADLPIKYLNI